MPTAWAASDARRSAAAAVSGSGQAGDGASAGGQASVEGGAVVEGSGSWTKMTSASLPKPDSWPP